VIVREIERSGIPIVQIANMVTIAKMVGTNRLLQGNSIVCPVGNQTLPLTLEKEVRRHIIEEALKLLQS